MDVLNNEQEMKRLHNNYINAVKEPYQCSLKMFAIWLDHMGHENHDTKECYVEIPSFETVSGNPVILDW